MGEEEAKKTAAADAAVPAVTPESAEVAVEEVKVPRVYYWGTGRRKSAIARVRICDGTGKIIVNKKPLAEFFTSDNKAQIMAAAPLKTAGLSEKLDVYVNVNGGGFTGQSGAIMMGLARALVKFESSLEVKLRHEGFLTRDSREPERKKYGQRGARARFQYSKR